MTRSQCDVYRDIIFMALTLLSTSSDHWRLLREERGKTVQLLFRRRRGSMKSIEEEESSEHNLMNPAAVISCHNKLYIVYWIHELDSILIT